LNPGSDRNSHASGGTKFVRSRRQRVRVGVLTNVADIAVANMSADCRKSAGLDAAPFKRIVCCFLAWILLMNVLGRQEQRS